MNAAVLHGPGDLRYEQVDVPVPGDGENLVKIHANGICGSDIHFFEAGRLGPFVVDRPYIPGHEAVGTVVETDVRVVIEPGVPCRRCDFCKRGLYNLCRDVRFLSAPPVNGTFGEYIAHPRDFLFPIPDELSNEEAALAEPVSVGIHACNRAGLRAGASVVIVGSGPIGLITMLVARAYGAGSITVVDLEEHRLDKAMELGATSSVRAGDVAQTVERVEATLGDDGAEFVFDASGSSAGCSLSVRLARPAGVVTVIGWPEYPEFTYPVELIIERELDVRGINRYRNTYPTAIELMSQRKIDVGTLVSHRFAFEDIVEAFEFASTHRNETIKVLVSH